MSPDLPVVPPADVSAPSAAQRKVRNYLLDAPLQLKFAGSVVALTLLVSGLLGAFLWRTTDALFAEATSAVEARERAAEASRELGNATLSNEVVRHLEDKAFEAQLRERSEAIDRAYEQERQAVVAARAQLVARQKATLFALGGGLVGFVVFLSLFSIVASHRIVGPVYRAKQLAQAVGEGSLKVPSERTRPGDELRDLIASFVEMVRGLRRREEQTLERVAAARFAAERQGADSELIRALQTLEAKLRSSLD